MSEVLITPESTKPYIWIDPDLRDFFPPLDPDDFARLEENIRADGCREPIVVWVIREEVDGWEEYVDAIDNGQKVHCKYCHKDQRVRLGDGVVQCNGCGQGLAFVRSVTIVDGHNRYEICKNNGIPFKIIEKDFDSYDHVKIWMIENQRGRRRLTDFDNMKFRAMYHELLNKGRGGNRGNQHTVAKPQNEGLPEPKSESTAEKVGREFGVSRATVERDVQTMRAVEAIKPQVPDIEDRMRAGEVTRQAVVEAAKEPERAEEIIKPKPRGTLGTGENEWYTPVEYIAAARAVLGEIDLDPASSDIANETVKAAKFFTLEDDGLTQEWRGRVWMNPPYAQPAIQQFSEKLALEIKEGRTASAIALTHNYTDTRWFHHLAKAADAICFTRGRIGFLSPSGQKAAPTQGQAFFYFGRNLSKFTEEFCQFGFIVEVLHDGK
jgi:phage N-6-adenine-methyltransferase